MKILAVAALCISTPSISGFSNSPLSTLSTRKPSLSASSLVKVAQSSSSDVVVISPPGGIGEIATVEAARLGGSVKWFVVSAPSSSSSTGIALTAETLSAIEEAGGSIELAGANADSLLVNSDDGTSAASAVSTWCRGTKSILCTYDGAEEEKRRVDEEKSADERGGNDDKMIRSSIRVAAREAVGVAGAGVSKIAILSSGEEMGDEEEVEQKGKGFLGGLFGGNAVEIPDTMSEAMRGATAIVRHGELFGAPESSVSFCFHIGETSLFLYHLTDDNFLYFDT